jgi:N-acetylmuramoyl-L-alanine amidase
MSFVFVKPKRWINRVYIHCTDSDAIGSNYERQQLVKVVDQWHKARGWSGIGYHFIVDKLGNIMAGRDIEKIPAAQVGRNIASIAICLHGKDPKLFTEAAFDTLIDFCNQVDAIYNTDTTTQVSFHGHSEVSPEGKTCPNFDYKTILNLDTQGNLQ